MGAQCPIRGCGESREEWQVMCFAHWRRVPRKLAFAVYKAYREARGSAEHVAAIRIAIEHVQEEVSGGDGEGPAATVKETVGGGQGRLF